MQIAVSIIQRYQYQNELVLDFIKTEKILWLSSVRVIESEKTLYSFLLLIVSFYHRCGNQRENAPQHYFSLSQDDLFWNHSHHCWGRDCIKYRLCDLSLNMVVKPAVTLHDDWWISLPVTLGIRVSEWVYSEGRGSFKRLALHFMNTKSKVIF